MGERKKIIWLSVQMKTQKGRHSYSGILYLCWNTCLHLVSKDTLKSLSGRQSKQAYLLVPLFIYIMFQKGFQASPTPISPPPLPCCFGTVYCSGVFLGNPTMLKLARCAKKLSENELRANIHSSTMTFLRYQFANS